MHFAISKSKMAAAAILRNQKSQYFRVYGPISTKFGMVTCLGPPYTSSNRILLLKNSTWWPIAIWTIEARGPRSG